MTSLLTSYIKYSMDGLSEIDLIFREFHKPSPPNNSMHPTADTAAVMYINGTRRRLNPGVSAGVRVRAIAVRGSRLCRRRRWGCLGV
jgi:hypothetical protein